MKGIPVEYDVKLDDSYFYDENGKLREQLKPMEINGKIITTSGWPIYDTSKGHCGLCGSFECMRNGQTCQGGA